MDPVFGGVGLGLVWGWWIAAVAWAARADLSRALAGLAAMTALLAVGVTLLLGAVTTLAVVLAAIVATFLGYGLRLELGRSLEPGG